MSLGSGLVAAVLAGSVGFASVQVPADPGGQDSGQAFAQQGSDRLGTVTLLTGDRVVVTPAGHRVEPGPGRRVRYSTRYRDGHLHVYPSDAFALVAQGVLDERLFDVTQLLEWGYGDERRGDIPLIAQGDVPAPRSARQAGHLSQLGMSAMQVPKESAAEAWKGLVGGARTLSGGKTKLWLDGKRSFNLDRSVKQIGAPQAWQQGLTGKGVTVAVLDSGYDPDHPDLKGVVTQARDFTGGTDARDNVGHGTHVASIVAGAGDKQRGVAPDAKIALGKVGDRVMFESHILAGMEWAAVEVKAKVVNMSLGGPDTPDADPLEQAVDTLSERTGALFVISAGNDGLAGTVGSPGSADAALTVGAVDRDDMKASFSSAGPRKGDHAIKPDVTAPGVEIMAAAAAGTADGPYVAHSGTSMAAPHVAGAAAILAQRHPDWNGARLKAALIGSATPNGSATPYQEGAGKVDLVRALAQPVVATTGNVWETFPWNGTGERVATKTLTYANSGDTPVTLDLTTSNDVLRLEQQRLEVPAEGEASVELTIHAEGKGPGDYAGTVTARSGDIVVRTLAGAYVEPELYDLTVKAVGKECQPLFVSSGEVYDLKTGGRELLFFQRGVAKVRLPKGDWNLYADVGDDEVTMTAHQAVPLTDADREVTLDVREGRQVRFAVDEPTAQQADLLEMNLINGSWMFGFMAGGGGMTYYALPVRTPGLTYLARTVWHKKDTRPSPYRYDLVQYHENGIPDDPTYTARTSELVKVEASYRAPGTAARARAAVGVRLPGHPWNFVFPYASPAMDLPGTMTHYRTPGFAWTTEVGTGTHVVAGTTGVLQRGTVKETWNAAVTGPAFGTPAGDRDGDRLRFSADRLFTDATSLTGADSSTTGTLTLARGGAVLARADLAGCAYLQPARCLLDAHQLPAEAADYTLTASAQRQGTLSTAIESVWTFRSERTTQARALPLMAVRYVPAGLDDHNRAKPRSLTRIPIRVERNPGAKEARVVTIKLEASFDDGGSWRPVPVVPSGSGRAALLANPATSGYVSLRATVTDSRGGRVTQTVTRAYAVG
ncbi:S8 family serine peptidase [Nonomuraea ceibae]|uniref:S8 family serine peptidase n=1 Tax=Nonomuraea ceibae TaxID=1935170 RepID=UPI001C5CCD5E|nr:S8 family serine peptidase [Nonomuraea ceibae]